MVFLYGSLDWGLYPKNAIENNISWEGHLSVFVMGIVIAIFYKNEGPQRDTDTDADSDTDVDTDADTDADFDDIDPETQKPYWDVPEPDKDELTVRYRFRR